MTDQTEPKYKIGQTIQDVYERVLIIRSTQLEGGNKSRANELIYMAQSGNEGKVSPLFEDEIIYPVAIHPIEHHKCKDCEHWALENDQPKITCPTSHWMDKHFYSEISNTEDMEPPPNCYCFTPKLSPDEKDSLKQSENDFATGNILTKDEAFEKLGWKESK